MAYCPMIGSVHDWNVLQLVRRPRPIRAKGGHGRLDHEVSQVSAQLFNRYMDTLVLLLPMLLCIAVVRHRCCCWISMLLNIAAVGY